MERLSKAQRKRDKETAQMTKTEPRTDFRKLRDKGHSLIGKTVTFKLYQYDAVIGTLKDTGKQETGTVERWHDVTQTLQVSVDGYPTTFSVRLEHIVQGE